MMLARIASLQMTNVHRHYTVHFHRIRPRRNSRVPVEQLDDGGASWLHDVGFDTPWSTWLRRWDHFR